MTTMALSEESIDQAIRRLTEEERQEITRRVAALWSKETGKDVVLLPFTQDMVIRRHVMYGLLPEAEKKAMRRRYG
jgi:hypothetical protein